MTPWWILNVVQPWIKQLQEHMREPRVSTVIPVDFQTKATWMSQKNNGETERKLGKFCCDGKFLVVFFVLGSFFWLINRKESIVKRGKTEEYLFDRSWRMGRRFREEVGTYCSRWGSLLSELEDSMREEKWIPGNRTQQVQEFQTTSTCKYFDCPFWE